MCAVAENPYYKRDFRRAFPKTEVVTQGELAKLLIAQGGFQACVLRSSLLVVQFTQLTEPSYPATVSLPSLLPKDPKLPRSLPIPPPLLSQLSTLPLPSPVVHSNLLLLPVPSSGTLQNEIFHLPLVETDRLIHVVLRTDGHLQRKMLLMILILTSPCTSPTLLKLKTKRGAESGQWERG